MLWRLRVVRRLRATSSNLRRHTRSQHRGSHHPLCGHRAAVQIYVALPLNYGDSNQRFPAVYVLDADFLFGMAVDIARSFILSGEVQQVIVVGVAYGTTSLSEWSRLRRRDFTPTRDLEWDREIQERKPPGTEIVSGGAGAFL